MDGGSVMDKFTASNGGIVETEEGWLQVSGSGSEYIDPRAVPTLREFFQAERDEELGRWRPEGRRDVWALADSDDPNRVLVVSDTLSTFATWTRDGIHQTSDNGGWAGAIARAYFDAHPERKPWEGAQPGEIWVLTLEGDEVAYQCTSSFAGHVYFGGADDTIELNSTMITAARRIWPEMS
jgi:hypothetical protein